MRLVQNVSAQHARDCFLCQPAGKGVVLCESIFKAAASSSPELLSSLVSELRNAALLLAALSPISPFLQLPGVSC